MAESVALSSLREGDRVVVGGDRQVIVDAALAAAFAPGDRLIVAGTDVLHIPAADADVAAVAVGAAVGAVTPLARCSGASITAFFEDFARRLEDPSIVALLRAANERDVADAAARGRSTTRLVLDDAMLAAMVEGLRMWRDTPDLRDVEVARVDHDGWHVAARQAPLGAVGFVFEGRPNVFADAGKHRGPTYRLGCSRDGNSHRRTCCDAGTVGCWAAHRRHGAGGFTGPCGWLGDVRRRPAGAGGGPGVGCRGSATRRGRAGSRHAGQPARHRRCVGDRRR
jgi:hypothetical protein